MDNSKNYNVWNEPYASVLSDYAEIIGHPFNSEGHRKAVRGFWQIEKISAMLENITPSGLTSDNPKCKYDAWWRKRIVEAKFKECSSKKWADFTISPGKIEFVMEKEGWLIVVYDDGVFFVWDLRKYRPWQETIPTKHKKYSSDFGGQDNPYIDEYMYHFEYDKAIFTGSIKEGNEYLFKITN